MELHYERIAQVIALSAVGDTDLSISSRYIKEGKIKIKFSEYVKSQVHLNIVHGLYGRSLKEYVETLYFLQGKTSKRATALKVLKYFYEDAARFLINNKDNIHLELVVDTENFELPKQMLSIAALKTNLLQEFEKVLAGKISLNDWKYSAILDSVKDAGDMQKKAESYALAYALQTANGDKITTIIESE